MKIAIFSDTFLPQANGAATTVYQSAKSLMDLGHEVAIFSAAKNSKKYIEQKYNNLKIFSLPSFPALVYPTQRLALPFLLSFNQLKKFKPDIIHTHTPFAVGWEAIIEAKILKIPLVGTHHTFYDDYLKHVKLDYKWGKKFSWKYTVAYYNRCDLVLSPSQTLADALKKQGLKRPIAVLPNSLDTDFFYPSVNFKAKNALKKLYGIKNKSLIFQGRLSYEKSLDIVLKAFALMLKKDPGLQLMMVGDGPEKNNLEKLADKLKIKDHVIFTGYIPYGKKIVEIYQANDIYLPASKSENMPMSILEAMACGLPIIAVKERGLAELIKSGVNGFFVKTDNPKNMAEKTLDLLADSDSMEKISQSSRLLALGYSDKAINKLLEEFYLELLKKRS